jgi:hypothetical protein
MIDILLGTMLAAAEPPYEPPPETWYPQAVACAASAMVAKGRSPTGDQIGEIMTFGMIVADVGRKSGRTKEQVESDVKVADSFYRHLKDRKPKAFAAHRSYCGALLDADRP